MMEFEVNEILPIYLMWLTKEWDEKKIFWFFLKQILEN